MLTTGVCLGVGAYGAKSINTPRQRWFSDNFVLTPETLRMPFRQVTLTTADDVALNGWFIEQTVRGEASKKLVLCCCPYNQDKSSLLGLARSLWDGGYSVLLFDFRSHAPVRTAQTIGYLEKRDGDAALGWLLEQRPEGGSVGMVGASMGGAVALMLAAERRPGVAACATDCAFSSLKDVVGLRVDRMFPTRGLFGLDSALPLHAVFLEAICALCAFWYGYSPADVGPRKHLQDVDIPLLVVHSEHDSVVPVAHGREIYAQSATSREHKSMFVVKGAEHVEGCFMDEKQYGRRIVAFLDKYMQGDKPADSIFVPHEHHHEDDDEPEPESEIEANVVKEEGNGIGNGARLRRPLLDLCTHFHL